STKAFNCGLTCSSSAAILFSKPSTLKTLKSFCLNVYLVIVVLLITVILYTYFIIILFDYIKNNANIKNKLGAIVMELYKFAYQIIQEAARHISSRTTDEK